MVTGRPACLQGLQFLFPGECSDPFVSPAGVLFDARIFSKCRDDYREEAPHQPMLLNMTAMPVMV